MGWSAQVFRWTNVVETGATLEITADDGTVYEYRGGLADLDWQSEFLLFAESSAPPVISLDLRFLESDDIAGRVEAGASLATMTATLYRWAPGMSWDERVGVFYGQGRDPTYGGDGEPVSVTFEAPLYRDGSVWPPGRVEAGQLSVDSDLATGDPYPIVFGSPGISDEILSERAGSPAYPVDRSGKVLLVGTAFGSPSFTALWSVSRNATESAALTTTRDSLGRSIRIVTSSSVDFDADDDYAVQWDGTGMGAGDLLIECARACTTRVDLSRLRAVAPYLNRYKVAGYIDSKVKAWDFAVKDILPLLPASLTTGAGGVYIRTWNANPKTTDARASLTEGVEVCRVGRVQYERQDVINEITIRYAPNWSGEYTEARTLSYSPAGQAPEVVASPYARISRSRVAESDPAGPQRGVRSELIETPYVFEEATAIAIASWKLRARWTQPRVVIYEDVTGRLEYLEDGDHVLITDASISLSSKLAMVRTRRWSGGRFYLSLLLVDDPVRGI